MGRIVESKASKGSQKWIQILVNGFPEVFNQHICRKINLPDSEQITWCSPIKDDDYSEYRDQDFLDLLDVDLPIIPLEEFWPTGGPVWDGLGKSSSGKIFLVEAKAHINEILSSGTGAGTKSKELIDKSLQQTKQFLNSKSNHDWSSTFYQYTNRLAHLYLLRTVNKIPAYLVFLYFVNDTTMKGPRNVDEWEGAIKLLHALLGIGRHKLKEYVIDVFIDVNELKGAG